MSAESAAAPPTLLTPVSAHERIATLDILRGFALFGILLVNMEFFGTPVYRVVTDVELWTSAIDRAAEIAIVFFAEGKFYSLFSFLFGLGFSIQMLRAESRGARIAPLYARRLAILLGIGIVHAFLLWMGDILITYALLGFLLLLFRKRSPRALLIWAAALLLIPVILNGAIVGLLALGRAQPEVARDIEKQFAEDDAHYRAQFDASMAAYRSPNYGDIFRQRAADVAWLYSPEVLIFGREMPNILAMFLLGLYAGRRGIFHRTAEHLPFIQKVQRWGFILGFIGTAGYTLGTELSNPSQPSVMSFLATAFFAFGGPALSLFYASTLTLLVQQSRWREQLAPLGAMGRMALTNYLLQSIICTTIFYGYGLGFFGRIGPAMGIALTIVIYGIQIPLSVWWLSQFKMGPAEWLWRTLTYGKPQPMRA